MALKKPWVSHVASDCYGTLRYDLMFGLENIEVGYLKQFLGVFSHFWCKIYPFQAIEVCTPFKSSAACSKISRKAADIPQKTTLRVASLDPRTKTLNFWAISPQIFRKAFSKLWNFSCFTKDTKLTPKKNGGFLVASKQLIFIGFS